MMNGLRGDLCKDSGEKLASLNGWIVMMIGLSIAD
jgi:hypothetical protein